MPDIKNCLILSCSTGGGHNSAAEAIRDELKARGHEALLMDPFSLKGPGLPNIVANAYIKLVQRFPKVFGVVYRIGMTVSRHQVTKSPVYYANALMMPRMEAFLAQHSFDAIFITHLFPAEILTRMKNKGCPLPKIIFVCTDYTCIPFTEETDCDFVVIPHKDLKRVFAERGMTAHRLLPLGIPVRKAFTASSTSSEKINARKKLRLQPDRRYFLVVGGSMGAGKLPELADLLVQALKDNEAAILVCGNNRKLYDRLFGCYGNHPQVLILKRTKQMPLYMTACDVMFSKPGGLSSTEAAVVGIPLVLLDPIPGCETENREFFRKRGLCLTADTPEGQVAAGRRLMDSENAKQLMRKRQREQISRTAAQDICDLIE